MQMRARVGEKLRPFAAQLAGEVGGVKHEVLLVAQVLAGLFFAKLYHAPCGFFVGGVDAVGAADVVQREHGQIGEMAGDVGVFAAAR